MLKKPRLLDLFCGAGGAARGYQLAGFHVTGVDLYPQPRYIGDAFLQDDAIAYVLANGWKFDAIHASPLCQAHSNMKRMFDPDDYASRHPDLIPHTRFALQSLGLPFIIENVEGARAALRNPVMLCGADFGLKVYRHRLFESNITLYVPEHMPHDDSTPPAGCGKSPKGFISLTGGGIRGVTQQERFDAMGIHWMSNAVLNQSIPPAFTEYLGRQLMAHINGEGLPIQKRLFA